MTHCTFCHHHLPWQSSKYLVCPGCDVCVRCDSEGLHSITSRLCKACFERPDPRILTHTAIEVLQMMCTFLEVPEIGRLARVNKSMGNEIIYGTDEYSVKSAAAHLWREHPQQRVLYQSAASSTIRPMRAIIRTRPLDGPDAHNMCIYLASDYPLTDVLQEKFLLLKHALKMLPSPNMTFVRLMCIGIDVDELVDVWPDMVKVPNILHDAMRCGITFNSQVWPKQVSKLIQLGANTNYVTANNVDLNDLARSRGLYKYYRQAVKHAKQHMLQE